MTETLNQKLNELAKAHFAKNNIIVTRENESALFDMFKAQYVSGHEIKTTHERLRSKIDDFKHPDRELSNLKVNTAMALIGNACNSGSSFELNKTFCEMFQFNTGHRSLDADVINLLFELIKFIAEDDSIRVDERNKHAILLCKDLILPMQS
jgi:hypothetical protein